MRKWADSDQVATLRRLTGVDFGEIDRARSIAYDERTARNRTAKEMRAAAASVRSATPTPPPI